MDSFTPYNGSEKEQEKKKKNKGVACGVKNCVHHDGVNYCTAEQIAVGPTYANSLTDTVCATFKQKSMK